MDSFALVLAAALSVASVVACAAPPAHGAGASTTRGGQSVAAVLATLPKLTGQDGLAGHADAAQGGRVSHEPSP